MRKRYSDLSYSLHIGPYEHNFIVKHGLEMSDAKMAVILKLPQNLIKYYRFEKINMVKTSGRKQKEVEEKKQEEIIPFTIEDELKAIINFPYNGVMFESAMARIKHLDKTLR